MYGLVNKAIEDLVTQGHGAETWQRIVERAGVELAGFISMEQYPDQLTYGLVGAASEELGVPAAELLEAFGKFWVLYTGTEGYGEFLDMSGSTFEEFLGNLDNLHMRVGLSFPELEPPSFRCEKLGPGRYHLRYYSKRQGLVPMVIGLVKGLAERFGLEVDVRLAQARSAERDHDLFVIEQIKPAR